MAKLVGGDPKQTKGISLKGQFMIDTFRGVIRVRKWPRKRGKPKTEQHQDQVDKFSQANRLAKYAISEQQIAAISATQGTSFYPRDLAIMSMYGRAFAIAFPGERTLYSMASRQDVSQSLDILNSDLGVLIGRGPNFWEGIPAGAIGQVLTGNGPDTLPSFKPAGDFTGGKGFTQLEAGASDTAPFATKGWWFQPVVPTRIHSMVATLAYVLNGTYKARVFELSGLTIQSIVSETPTFTAPGTIVSTESFHFTSTPTLTVGVDYAFMISRTDALDTTTPGTSQVFKNPPPLPMNFQYGWCRIAKKNPIATDVLAGKDTAQSPYPVYMIYEI